MTLLIDGISYQKWTPQSEEEFEDMVEEHTTVPMSIVKHLKLREKDKLKWELKPRENDFLIIVEPLEKRYRNDKR